jgi:hypothetical protein
MGNQFLESPHYCTRLYATFRMFTTKFITSVMSQLFSECTWVMMHCDLSCAMSVGDDFVPVFIGLVGVISQHLIVMSMVLNFCVRCWPIGLFVSKN